MATKVIYRRPGENETDETVVTEKPAMIAHRVTEARGRFITLTDNVSGKGFSVESDAVVSFEEE
jgi:hypothetical protein